MTIVHEVSHALGLKHPGKYNAGGGVTPGPYLSKALDNRKNTIMSYYDAPNAKVISYSGGTFTSSTVNPLGSGAFDIAALQYLYGAASPTSGQTYSWNTDQKFIQTLWDPTGQSAIDLGNQTRNNVVDLRAGRTSSIAVRDAYAEMPFTAAEYARLTTVVNGKTVKLSSVLGRPTYTGANNLTIAAGSQINSVTGGSGSDTIITNEICRYGRDRRRFRRGVSDRPGAGINGTTIDGGDGKDTLYVRKIRGYVGRSRLDLTLSTAATRTTAAVDVAQVAVQGIESIKYWNGNSYAASAARRSIPTRRLCLRPAGNCRGWRERRRATFTPPCHSCGPMRWSACPTAIAHSGPEFSRPHGRASDRHRGSYTSRGFSGRPSM